MIDGKWIQGLGPLLTVAEAARLTLQVRFEVVRYYLPLAMHESDRDLEHVHRLRVGTRRAAAALRIFSPVLSEKVHRRARRTLRAVRRAAGEARDWDVFCLDLRRRATKGTVRDRPGLDFLTGYAAGQRDAAQVHLVEAGRRQEERLRDVVATALRTIDEDNGPASFADMGRSLLRDLVQELSWAASRNLDDYEHLHQVRILGKQLRYAMEVFESCFGREFREELYPRVEEMQEILGLANDSHVAIGRLEMLRERLRGAWGDDFKRILPGIDSVLRFHRRRLPRQRAAFVQWWQQWQNIDVPRLAEIMAPPSEQAAGAEGAGSAANVSVSAEPDGTGG